MFKATATALILTLNASAAFAGLTVTFIEGAPKDRFTLTNNGNCPLPALQITVDLGTAPAGLIFDVTGRGAGVEVFQPFEVVAGAENLKSTPVVVDGDNAIKLDLSGIGAGQRLAFTIDVDDTDGGREITVSGSEIAGATVHASLAEEAVTGVFDDSAEADVAISGCAS